MAQNIINDLLWLAIGFDHQNGTKGFSVFNRHIRGRIEH